MVEVIINDSYVQLKKGEKIKYTFQVNDIFDLATVNYSFSNSFNIDKTPENTQTLKGLGLVGSVSDVPYSRVSARILNDGFDVISIGWLEIKTTSTTYQINIKNGVIDFFKDIENKTIGNDLNLSEINHSKTLDNVVNSFSNTFYKYVVADFGGFLQLNFVSGTRTNIDYLAPSVWLKYIWDKVFSTFGWTYSGAIFSSEDFTEIFLTYPKAPETESVNIVVADLKKNEYVENGFSVVNGEKVFNKNYNWDESNVTEGNLISNWSYRIPSDGGYNVNAIPKGYVYHILGIKRPYLFRIKRGSRNYEILTTNVGEEANLSFNDYFYEGEVLTFEIISPSIQVDPLRLFNNGIEVKISKTSLGEIDFNNSLQDFSIKDFIKEQSIRLGLTLIPDVDSRNIHFITIDERITNNEVEDWTDKYVERTKEEYVINSYAQKNAFRHKYNGENENHSDGYLYVNNKNLSEEKNIFTSRIYAPSLGLTNIRTRFTSFNSPILPIWESEVKEVSTDEGTTFETEYKGLNSRFYYIRPIVRNQQIHFISLVLGGQRTENQHLVANVQDCYFIDLVEKYYAGYTSLLNDSKIHEIDLKLGLADVLTLDMLKPKHFEQEASDYILNKLSWIDKEICTGEFIKINK